MGKTVINPTLNPMSKRIRLMVSYRYGKEKKRNKWYAVHKIHTIDLWINFGFFRIMLSFIRP